MDPEWTIIGPDQQVVEHLIVGKQDVRRREPQGVLV